MKNIIIKDIRKLITDKPNFIYEDTNFKEIISKFIANPINRSLYVVNKNKKLTGIINAKDILKKISIDFYSTSFLYKSTGFTEYDILSAIDNNPKDLVNNEIYYVKDNSTIESAFKLLFNNNIDSIPVVDDDLILIGDLNILELFHIWEKKFSKK